MKKILLPAIAALFFGVSTYAQVIGKTEITRWQYGKGGAASITFDDGSVNQFKQAIPVLNRLKMPATFFIITGQIPGSQYQGKFVGRPVKEIIAETATIPTNRQNLYERASAAGYLGLVGPLDYHYNAGSLIDDEKPEEAIKLIDELYRKVRNGDFKPGIQHNTEYMDAHGTTWAQIRQYAAKGHEFASHMITHPRLAILDEANMLYEMKMSRADILKQLGAKYTFSGEGPFGTENERVMQYAYTVYPALRNRMPEPWLKEISRGNKSNPGQTDKEYIQFQRGGTTKTPMPMMKGWVDSVDSKHGKTWLVLTFHGVDGIGWEALTHQQLDEYFRYIKNRSDIWVATFGDVTRYIRERMNAKVVSALKGNVISVGITHSLDKNQYNLPLTLKTYVPANWKMVQVKQGQKALLVKPVTIVGDKGHYILYQAKANGTPVTLSAQ